MNFSSEFNIRLSISGELFSSYTQQLQLTASTNNAPSLAWNQTPQTPLNTSFPDGLLSTEEPLLWNNQQNPLVQDDALFVSQSATTSNIVNKEHYTSVVFPRPATTDALQSSSTTSAVRTSESLDPEDEYVDVEGDEYVDVEMDDEDFNLDETRSKTPKRGRKRKLESDEHPINDESATPNKKAKYRLKNKLTQRKIRERKKMHLESLLADIKRLSFEKIQLCIACSYAVGAQQNVQDYQQLQLYWQMSDRAPVLYSGTAQVTKQIEVTEESSDKTLDRREKNKKAAQQFRAREKLNIKALEKDVADLQREIAEIQAIYAKYVPAQV